MRGWVMVSAGADDTGGTSWTRKSGEPPEATWFTADTVTP